MFKKISSVKALSDFRLFVCFVAGETAIYDVKPLFSKFPIFKNLSEVEGLFSCVQADTGGYGISWNDDIDLSCNELWDSGELIKSPFEGILSFKDATNIWGLNESTLRKAVSYGKLIEGVDVRKYGKQWVITKEAMIREYNNSVE